jgi:hypothetical protein
VLDLNYGQNFQLYYQNAPQDYIVCNFCRIVLKWTSETDTKVMKNHNCGNKSTPTTPNKKIKLMPRAQKVDEAITDEDNDDVQF